jgi:fructose-bisphosphate aldolase class I
MDKDTLKSTAHTLVATGKGILAADESFPTIKKRFDSIGVESTEDTRKAHRRLLFKTSGIEDFISGVIMYDETIKQQDDDGKSFPSILSDRGIIPGIKVDKGKIDMPNFQDEVITEGLDGLSVRLAEYKTLGARFTKWRTVVRIGEDTPTKVCIDSNSETQARFAALSQEANLVPIVEPEILMDGNHDIKKSREVTYITLKSVFEKLSDHKVFLDGMLLKTSMVVPGKDSGHSVKAKEVAKETIDCFREVVPSQVPGILLLSGGQTPETATANLNALNIIGGFGWELSFSFGRALQRPALEAWKGDPNNVDEAQKAFFRRARINSLARMGEYKEEMENE